MRRGRVMGAKRSIAALLAGSVAQSRVDRGCHPATAWGPQVSSGFPGCLARAVVRATAAAALLAGVVLGAASVQAQDATWLLTPGSDDFNTAANWSAAAVPTGTAFFDTSNSTALSFSAITTI